jgi:two-component system chemotaxis sensor kinase CheA
MVGEIDLGQFHEIFYEESFENLEAMEVGLLALDLGTPDAEVINTVFRAAHSIKGGAATFGFSAISDFTHIVETLLDEVRSGIRSVTVELIDTTLASIDLIRSMLAESKSGEPIDQQRTESLITELQMLGNSDSEGAVDKSSSAGEPVSNMSVNGAGTDTTWHIKFLPHERMLMTGNEPFRMIRELKLLGNLEITSHADALPSFADLDPEICHLNWDLALNGQISRAQIDDVFEWVEGDCTLEIEALETAASLPGNMDEITQQVGTHDGDAGKVEGVHTRTSHPSRRAEDNSPQSSQPEASSIRVSINKVDSLIDLVGELVITQSMLNQFSKDFREEDLEKLLKGIEQLNRHTRELQEETMGIRMLPVDFVFQRLPRLVRDLSNSLGKQVELKLEGGQTEIDKTILEKISDPLMHLIRNALDHGIESPEDRKKAGKPAVGLVEIKAFHEGGNVFIQIADDGAGLKSEIIHAKAIEQGLITEEESMTEIEVQNLIFAPGFSTSEEISDISGRGVGMDVVSKNINDLNGVVEVSSAPGEGSVFSIKLPLTLAILDGQLVRVGQENFIISMLSIVKSIRVKSEHHNDVVGSMEVYRYLEEYIPFIRLDEVYDVEAEYRDIEDAILIVVDVGERFGILVDEVLGQQQFVIKSLESNYRQVPSIAGATILGNGKVAMILDAVGLLAYSRRQAKIDGSRSAQL